jgi:hypothetical protein
MASVTLLHPEQTFTIPALQVMTKCTLFQNNPTLLASPYRVQSPVSLSIFREFLSALEGNAINITDTNLTELHQLYEEFGFTEIGATLTPQRPSVPSLDSQIITNFPKIFAEFRQRRFSLLWRGSRDGFGSTEFHRRRDGHANTLTVILDTKGNIFGGFTPLEWESRASWPFNKGDDSLKSFLFTLKNPHNMTARKFAK